jgi:drug/metabolite transporter (DMT)-like permease
MAKNLNSPIRKFAFFAFLDAAAAFLFSIGAPNTPATLQNIINQAVIPATMIVTMILLKVRYQLLKLGGAGVILIGAVIALIPLFIKGFQLLLFFSVLTRMTKGLIPMDHQQFGIRY